MWGAGAVGEGNARDARAMTLSKGPEWMGICRHDKGIAFLSKLFLLANRNMHPLNLCMFRRKRDLCTG
jgi:hypothetical protein